MVMAFSPHTRREDAHGDYLASCPPLALRGRMFPRITDAIKGAYVVRPKVRQGKKIIY